MNQVLDDIEQLLPHRGPMRLIDRVLTWGGPDITVGLTVPLDGPFHEAAGVPVWIGLEYMAQTIGAWVGCEALSRGKSPRLGFLVGTRRYSAEVGHFVPGTVLRVHAHCELADETGLSMFACHISQEDDRVLARANISAYQPDDARLQEMLAA